MPFVSQNIKFQLKKIAILVILFSAVFFGAFYVVNFFDPHPASKQAIIVQAPADNLVVNRPENQNGQASQAVVKRQVKSLAFEDWARINNLDGSNLYDGDQDKDGLANYLEYLHGTDPNNADTDGDNFSDAVEIKNGYDPDAKGEAMTTVSVEIEKMGVSAPMIWSKTDVEDKMLADLESGLAHFVKTASPGQNGNMIVSGHSSNYLWAKGGYNHIFEKLNDLQAGDRVTIKAVQRNGRMFEYEYKITEKYVTAPDDEKIFANTPNPTLTLSTCWPLGTSLRRLIVKGELVQ
ncbi:MAG: sortase [Candidatus Moraniibacteriota bacterium]